MSSIILLVPFLRHVIAKGARIRKNETLEAAFRRICCEELGKSFNLSDAQFLGVFEHFYSTNFAERPGVGTHYVVLAYELASPDLPPILPGNQHGDFQWFEINALLADESVHPHTKAYFNR